MPNTKFFGMIKINERRFTTGIIRTNYPQIKTAITIYLQASDIMIWHVPNDVRLSRMDNQAFLKYYTNSGFLQKYGSNLKTFFSRYYPLVLIPPTGTRLLRITDQFTIFYHTKFTKSITDNGKSM